MVESITLTIYVLVVQYIITSVRCWNLFKWSMLKFSYLSSGEGSIEGTWKKRRGKKNVNKTLFPNTRWSVQSRIDHGWLRGSESDTKIITKLLNLHHITTTYVKLIHQNSAGGCLCEVGKKIIKKHPQAEMITFVRHFLLIPESNFPILTLTLGPC